MTEHILHITAGKGPEECRWVVGQLARAYHKEAEGLGIQCEAIDPVDGNPATLLLRVVGDQADAFIAERTGTILWIGTSPFRPHHRRRNWFVGVTLLPPVEQFAALREEDIRYQAMRASGPGGQHVNKTDSAVRATHGPTGLTSFSQDQRSQHANRKIARLKLAILIAEQEAENAKGQRLDGWLRNQNLERGNAVRTYHGERFKLKA